MDRPVPDPVLSYMEYCTRLFELYAEQDADCRGGDAEDWLASFFVVDERCAENEAAIDKGHVRFDLDKANACLREIRTEPCEGATSSPCSEVETTLHDLDAGDDCSDGEYCAKGLFCNDSGDTCPPTCQAQTQEGGRCSVFEACAGELFCSHDGSGRNGTCRRPPSIGEPCLSFDICGEGFCDPDSKKCRAFLREGDECASGAQANGCDRGLVCVQEGSKHFCRHRCQGDPSGRVGDPCTPEQNECRYYPLFCNDDHVCAFSPRVGEPCGEIGDDDGFCSDGFCSAQAGVGTCLPFVGEGGACASFFECDYNLICENGTCTHYGCP